MSNTEAKYDMNEFAHQSASLVDSSSGGGFEAFNSRPQQQSFQRKDDHADSLTVNKKSDWTMDMPKIEYQPDIEDEEDDGDSESQNIVLDGDKFLSEDDSDTGEAS